MKKQVPVPYGQVVATPGAIEAMERNNTAASLLMDRHVWGDWGTVCPEDAALNDEATYNGNRILSSYTLADATRIWIITEADRSVTTFLLPEEY
jgi:hypothetical protein